MHFFMQSRIILICFSSKHSAMQLVQAKEQIEHISAHFEKLNVSI